MRSPKSLPKRKKPKLFVVRRVHGESMLPTLQPGRVIIGVRARRIRRGDVVIVAHDGLEKVKRVKYSRHGKVFLVGDKPDRSTDSRSFGAIGEDAIVAKVIWPRIKAR